MPEKTKNVHPMEMAQAADSDATLPTSAEQDVLAILHDKTEHRLPGSPKLDEGTLGVLHTDIEGCETFPLLQKYVSGELPTLKTMFGNLKPFLDLFAVEIEKERLLVQKGEPDALLESMVRAHRLIAGREQQVRAAVRRYVNSVVRFRSLQRLTAGGSRDMTKQFVDADIARRKAHDSLIESLSIYTAQIEELKADGFDDILATTPFVAWHTTDDARTYTEETTVVMSRDALKNRAFIRDWAIVADFAEQIELLGDDAYLQSMRDHSPK